MAYFTQDYTDFFKELAANNHKEWFHTHKKRYEKSVKAPFEAFVADLIQAVQAQHDPEMDLLPKDAIFRINRDIRFSKNKAPYKLNRSAVISRGGRREKQIPGFYLQLGVEELWLGGGAYQPDKHYLRRIRQHIADHPQQTVALLQQPAFVQYYTTIQGAVNKRIPKEFKAAYEQQPLIANKQYYYMATYEDAEVHLLRDDLLEWTMAHYQASLEWQHFLTDAFYEPKTDAQEAKI